MNKTVYAWRRPAVGYSLQLVIDHDNKTMKKGYCLSISPDHIVKRRADLESIAATLTAAGYTLITD